MYKDIKEFINDEFDTIKIDKKFKEKIDNFYNYWYFKKAGDGDHSDFLGSPTIGVYKIVFSTEDHEKFFKEVMQKDEETLREKFLSIPDINPAFKISSNPFYLTIVCLMHMTVNKSYLNNKDTEDLLEKLYFLMSVKMLSSMLNHTFKYPPSEAAMLAAYENLSLKYLLKKTGCWYNAIIYKSAEIKPRGIFSEKLKHFTTLNAVYIINQIQIGYKSICKNMYKIFKEALDNKTFITTTSLIESNIDGSTKIAEHVKSHINYVNYLKNIINSYSDFYKDDLIYLIGKFIPSINLTLFEKVISELTDIPYPKEPEFDYIEKIIVSSFSYLNTCRITDNYLSHLGPSIKYLKGYWSSGKIKEPLARDAKKLVSDIISNLLNGGNKNTMPPLIIGLCIYIYIRALIGLK